MVVVKSILYSSSSRFSKLQEKEKKKKNTLKKKVQIHTAMLIPICMEEAVNRNSNATPGLPVHC
jgi:predicted nucleotide-binding protein (sugar kinase/HSP70/actin superfamily)